MQYIRDEWRRNWGFRVLRWDDNSKEEEEKRGAGCRGSQPHLQLIATNFAVQITNCISGLAAQRRVRSVCNDKAYRGNDITAAPAPPPPLSLSPFFTHPQTIFYDRLCVNVSVFLLFLCCVFVFFCKFYGAQIKFALRLRGVSCHFASLPSVLCLLGHKK